MTKPRSLQSLLRRAVLRSVAMIAGLALGWFAAQSLGLGAVEVGAEGPQSALGDQADSIRPPVKTSPAYLLDQHAGECWTLGQTGGLPSAAIVQDRDGVARWTVDPAEVDAAFSEVLHSIGFDEEPVARRFDVIALRDR